MKCYQNISLNPIDGWFCTAIITTPMACKCPTSSGIKIQAATKWQV